MEKIPKMTKETQSSSNSMLRKSVIWDCESSLYDSFELKSFERQLDSAIASRTMSMPHLANNRVVPISSSSSSQYSQSYHMSKKGSNKISRSFQKIIKSVFRSNHNSPFPPQEATVSSRERSNALSPVSEVAKYDDLSSSDIRSSLERRIKSTRFTVTTSC